MLFRSTEIAGFDTGASIATSILTDVPGWVTFGLMLLVVGGVVASSKIVVLPHIIHLWMILIYRLLKILMIFT